MPSISALSLRVLVRCPTLIDLNLPLESHVGIAGKWKKLLTYTHDTTRANLERLLSARLIHGDQRPPLHRQRL
jgi:hypothetical protein